MPPGRWSGTRLLSIWLSELPVDSTGVGIVGLGASVKFIDGSLHSILPQAPAPSLED